MGEFGRYGIHRWGVGTLVKVMENESRDQEGSKIEKKRNNDGNGGIRRGGVGNWGSHGHAQGGTYEETPLPATLVVDRAARFLTEAEVGFSMVKVKVVKPKVLELVFDEAQFPGNVCPPDGEGIVVCWSEGHGIVVK